MVVYATVTGAAGWGAVAMAFAAAGSTTAAVILRYRRLPTELLTIGPLAFSPAKRARRPTHLAQTALQLLAFWGLFLAIIPLILSWLEHRWGLQVELPAGVPVAGWVLCAAASAHGLWSAYAMSIAGEGTPLPSAMPRKLVVTGPYGFVRNPMAVAGIVQGIGVGLGIGSWIVVLYAILGSLVWNWIIRPLEEADLAARFGDDYARYEDEVTCWVPGPRFDPELPHNHR